MDEVDWRYKISAKIAKDCVFSNGQVAKKGADLKLVSNIDLSEKKILTIPVPDLTALYINSSAKSWKNYSDLRDANKIISSLKKQVCFLDDKDAFNAIENIAVAVITAYTAIEAFCNESIPDNHDYWHNKRSELILEKSSKKEIERYFSVANKLNNILPEIYGVDHPKGKSPIWVSFKKLKECRDGLIHAKSHEVRSARIGKANLWSKLFKLKKPYLLARDVFEWYFYQNPNKPLWLENYPY